MRTQYRIGLALMVALWGAGCRSLDFESVLATAGGAPSGAASVVAGLKEALDQGVSVSTARASQPDGFYKNPLITIMLPPDARQVERTLRQMGLGGEVDNALLTLNRAAERAAAEAKPIFLQAIRDLTFQDAVQILHGEPDAATQYLRRSTEVSLVSRFEPMVRDALSHTGATRYYGDLARAYNAIPLTGRSIDPDLTRYTTHRLIDGLFLLIAEEESAIRVNPLKRSTRLMRKVFAAQDSRP